MRFCWIWSVGYRRFQIGCLFVENDLLDTTTFIQNCIYLNFRINLTQFYVNFSIQEHQIDVLNVSFNAWDFQVSSYTPFLFFLYSPFKYKTYLTPFMTDFKKNWAFATNFDFQIPISWRPNVVNLRYFIYIYIYIILD